MSTCRPASRVHYAPQAPTSFLPPRAPLPLQAALQNKPDTGVEGEQEQGEGAEEQGGEGEEAEGIDEAVGVDEAEGDDAMGVREQ